jgi:predicted SnoaL-like aldol condensation-catalyzing enzyme
LIWWVWIKPLAFRGFFVYYSPKHLGCCWQGFLWSGQRWSIHSRKRRAAMTEADNKTIIRRFVEEGLNKRQATLIDEVYAADYTGHDPDRPAPRTVEDLKQGMVGLLGKVFPDAQYSIEELVAEGDTVVWHWTFRATHQGEVMGIPPTGRPITFSGVNIFRLAGGKIVEDWVYRDTVGMLRQLGAMPAPGQGR